MPIITDTEFGDVVVRTHASARQLSLRVAPNGSLRISMPRYTPLIAAKMMLKTERSKIRELLKQHSADKSYTENQAVGKSHSLVIQSGASTKVSLIGTKIIATVSPNDDIADLNIQRQIREIILKTLRKEAKSYLPRRLQFIAGEHGFHYDNVKLTHSSSRWGSCSSRGTISLNIALMNLPFELLDYVLIHELCHTRQMNHSQEFWHEVAQIDPNYKRHRQALKQFTPNV